MEWEENFKKKILCKIDRSNADKVSVTKIFGFNNEKKINQFI